MKKVIYITPRYDLKKTYINETYYQNFDSKNFILVPLPFIFNINDLTQLIVNSAGVILLGGKDINPIRYKQENTDSEYIDKLDDFDFLVIDICFKNNVKLFGICRGLQLINVYFNGTLHQNILNHNNTIHKIIFNKPFFIYKDICILNSFHHQSINKIGNNLDVIATSNDGTIEAIIHKNKNIAAVQFHPEFYETFTMLIDSFFI